MTSNGTFVATGVRATTLSPHHYHSLSVQDGTATLSEYMSDRALAFALANALGCLVASPALPKKDYRSHLGRMPFLASMLENDNPRLMRPLLKRMSLEGEGGMSKKVFDATSTGNMKTFFFVQEVPQGAVYRGAVFGADPFDLASKAEGRRVDEIVVRMGRHLGGMVKIERDPEVSEVRLNAHTSLTFNRTETVAGKVDGYPVHDLQPTWKIPVDEALSIVKEWRAAA